MLPRHRLAWRAAALLCATHLVAQAPSRPLALGEPRTIAPGILLYHSTDASVLTPEAPLSVWLLRLDPARVELRTALANDEIMGTETVAGTAARHRALAAINGGFFLPNGDPTGVLTVNGRIVSDSRRPRGAVGISMDGGGLKLLFARLRATVTLSVDSGAAKGTRLPIDGIDTTRVRGQLMLFTPSYHADTDTAPGGLEWVVDRQPLRVVSGPHRNGKAKIPRNGFVLSFGGTTVPPDLARVRRGARVSLEVAYDPVEGEPDPWSKAPYILGGAGLLIRDGRLVEDWNLETFAKGFAENRHPRTMIGTASDRTIWLVTVDGRQPHLSAGMTLEELRAFAHRLDLANALNLDGGGSTTMWVQGQVVNSPSDATGPRPVSDALLVHGRASLER